MFLSLCVLFCLFFVLVLRLDLFYVFSSFQPTEPAIFETYLHATSSRLRERFSQEAAIHYLPFHPSFRPPCFQIHIDRYM